MDKTMILSYALQFASQEPGTNHRVLDRCVNSLAIFGNPDFDGIVDSPLYGDEDIDEVRARGNHDWSKEFDTSLCRYKAPEPGASKL